jgi:hypothetical protein
VLFLDHRSTYLTLTGPDQREVIHFDSVFLVIHRTSRLNLASG